jgi:hypothetical protein
MTDEHWGKLTRTIEEMHSLFQACHGTGPLHELRESLLAPSEAADAFRENLRATLDGLSDLLWPLRPTEPPLDPNAQQYSIVATYWTGGAPGRSSWSNSKLLAEWFRLMWLTRYAGACISIKLVTRPSSCKPAQELVPLADEGDSPAADQPTTTA